MIPLNPWWRPQMHNIKAAVKRLHLKKILLIVPRENQSKTPFYRLQAFIRLRHLLLLPKMIWSRNLQNLVGLLHKPEFRPPCLFRECYLGFRFRLQLCIIYIQVVSKSQIQCCQLLLPSGSISGSSFPHQLLPAPIPPPHPGLLPYQFSPIMNSDWGRFSDPLLLSAPKIWCD